MTSRVRVLIADDHPMVREGLGAMLGTQPDFEIVGFAGMGHEVLLITQETHPDVILMDLRMPDMDGATATAKLREVAPAVRVLVLTTYDSDADIVRAVEAGAVGYLLKDVPHEALFQAVRGVARGERHLATVVAEKLLRRTLEQTSEALTSRELGVLSLVAQGLSNKRVAAHLGVTEATVKAHLLRTFDKLGVDSRTGAVMVALERGLLSR